MKNLALTQAMTDGRDSRMVSAMDRIFGLILAVLLIFSAGVGVAYLAG